MGLSADGLEEGTVVKGSGEILFFVFLLKEAVKMVVMDGGYMDVTGCREVGVVTFGVFGAGGVEVFGLIKGFGDRKGLTFPVDRGIGGSQPGESEDDVSSSAGHNIESDFLEYSLDIGIQGTSMGDVPILVIRVVSIAGADGGGEFLGGETMF